MTIVIAGGTGFLGRALSQALIAGGHRVVVLTRSVASRTEPALAASAPSLVSWSPDGTAGRWASAIDAADAVINLAGESIGGGRWSEERKKAILESRLLATRSLVAAVLGARRAPKTLVSASAQGYYGERGDEIVTEECAAGRDFLAGVCASWEAEARMAESSSRVVLLRSGLVLSASEGALPRMLTPFKLFGGGPLGSGRQFMAWVHWRDWVGMVLWALEVPSVRGPLNLCAPSAVRNRDFAAALGRALHRPSWVPAPAFALRAALGEMADSLLLTSIRMVPKRAIDLGYPFEFEKLDEALRDLLG